MYFLLRYMLFIYVDVFAKTAKEGKIDPNWSS